MSVLVKEKTTGGGRHAPGTEYCGDAKFIDSFAKTSKDDLWMNTTFYTFTNYVGQHNILQDASVLDLGCGNGLFTRWAASQGASKVVGIDLSEEQVASAYAIEKGNPTGIAYYARDVMDIKAPDYGEFDVIIAVHLVCYADNPDKLQCMLQAISVCLKKGGRCIGVREILDSASKGPVLMKLKAEIVGGPMFSYEIIPQTGNIVDNSQDCDDYCACCNEFRSSDGFTTKFMNYAVRESTMLGMFHGAGFKVNWYGPMLSCSPEGRELFPPAFIDKVTNEYGKFLWYFDITKL